MKYTNNYNLKMPEQTDYINVDDFNYNFIKIDKQIREEIDKIPPINNATDISTGVVKIDKTEGEEAPHIVPTIGTFDSAIAVLKGDVVGKQDKLTAGDNIDIIGDTISAVDTITTINGKTGAISKDDITALGIPSQDTVYKKPSSEPISYIQGLQAELDSKVESYGTNPVLNIAVISAGGSTTGIPNNTLILELE